MFFIGLFLGMTAGIILMGTVAALGYGDRFEDAYQEGYDIGFYEAMSLKGDRNGKENKI